MSIEDDGFDGTLYTLPRWLIFAIGVVTVVLVTAGLAADYLL